MASPKGLFIFCLLHLCVQSVQGVHLEALRKMMEYFEENVQPKTQKGDLAQYAIAIVVPQAQCTDEKSNIQTVFSKEEAAYVKKVITDGDICVLCTESKNVIATRPQGIPKQKVHAEYALLYPPGNSPMDSLLAQADQNSCIVFYTYNSPCEKKCLSSKDNIFAGLENWKNKRKAINVFAFGELWDQKDIANDFKAINNQVPLYRCSKINNKMECLDCVKGETVIPFCLPRSKPLRLYFKKMFLSMIKSLSILIE